MYTRPFHLCRIKIMFLNIYCLLPFALFPSGAEFLIVSVMTVIFFPLAFKEIFGFPLMAFFFSWSLLEGIYRCSCYRFCLDSERKFHHINCNVNECCTTGLREIMLNFSKVKNRKNALWLMINALCKISFIRCIISKIGMAGKYIVGDFFYSTIIIFFQGQLYIF